MLSGGGGGGGDIEDFLRGATEAAEALLGEQATPEEKARRLAICEGCELRRQTAFGPMCGVSIAERARRTDDDKRTHGCGCYLKLKVKGAASKCPRDLW